MIFLYIILLVFKCEIPSNYDQRLYCNTCIAVVDILSKRLKGSRKEYDIDYSLEDICTQNNLVTYDFIPPQLVRSCNIFIANENNLIKEIFLKGNLNEEIDLCYNNNNNICIKQEYYDYSVIKNNVKEKFEDL